MSLTTVYVKNACTQENRSVYFSQILYSNKIKCIMFKEFLYKLCEYKVK